MEMKASPSRNNPAAKASGKTEWKQDFNQDLLVRWTEPTENKKFGNEKQEDN